jgi:DNA helicase-2/ATP-dependent DNA helicase PcrA
MVLDPPATSGDFAGPPTLDDDWLVLSTIHSAKGLEWDAVYVIYAANGCIPADLATGSDEEIEEELRLAYVATTRAKDFLYVLWPKRYYGRPPKPSDGHTYSQRSRFLTEEVVGSMETVATGKGRNGAGQVPTGPGARGAIAASLKAMWD